jgi:hypothetical protein
MAGRGATLVRTGTAGARAAPCAARAAGTKVLFRVAGMKAACLDDDDNDDEAAKVAVKARRGAAADDAEDDDDDDDEEETGRDTTGTRNCSMDR